MPLNKINNDNDNDNNNSNDNDNDNNNETELYQGFSSVFFHLKRVKNKTNPVLPGEQSMGLSFNTSSRRKLGSQCSNILTFFSVSKFTWMAISARKLSLSC